MGVTLDSTSRYLPHGDFHRALRSRVDAYFECVGRAPDHVPLMRLKSAIIFAWLIGSYLIALLVAQTWWQAALACFSIGLAMAAVGFNIQHDGGHRAYARLGWQNALAAASLDFIGASSYVWSFKHNIFHHSNPNCVGLDADIDLQPLCRLAPSQSRHRWQRFQHFYVWFLYSFLAVKWLFDDFRDVYLGTIGGQYFPRPKGAQLVHFVVGKAFFIGWSIVLPLQLHSARNVALGWAIGSATISVVLAMVFQLAHVVERTRFTTPACEKTRWAEHQVSTTANFAPGAPFLTWYVGGLNYQIEHHLFPRVCHLHLPALSPIVKSTCEEFGVPYLTYPTAFSALAAHVRWLRTMGSP
jgi:linoleoyl-CoA desaturase